MPKCVGVCRESGPSSINMIDFEAYFFSLTELVISSQRNQVIKLSDAMGREIDRFQVVSGKNQVTVPTVSGLLFLSGETGKTQRIIQP